MTELLPWTYPDGTQLIISWLSDLGEVRDKRPIGAPIPFWVVRRIGGGDNGTTDRGLYSIHCWTTDIGPAMDAHNRMMHLANRRYLSVIPGQYLDGITCQEKPREVGKVGDIRHYIGTYQVGVRICEVVTDDD